MNNYISLLSSLRHVLILAKGCILVHLQKSQSFSLWQRRLFVCSMAYINVNLAKLEARIHFGKSTSHSSCITESKFCMTNLKFSHESQGVRPQVMSSFERTLYSYANAFIKNLAITEHELFKYLAEIKLISLSNLWKVP